MSISTEDTPLGTFIKDRGQQIFFGNQRFNPQLKIKSSTEHFLHQVHGHLIIPASTSLKKADGHFCREKNKKLFIKTADCMPVFLSHPDKVIALHIGWRGLKARILTHALKLISDKKNLKIFIGPHIGYDSFQLDTRSAERLLRPHHLSLQQALNSALAKASFTQSQHFYLNLCKILKREGKQSNINESQFFDINIDTFKSAEHYSHRRNSWRRGQNFSYIEKV